MSKRVKILCFFTAWARVNGSTVEFNDSIMIHAASSHDIPREFDALMRWRIRNWHENWVGPCPQHYQLNFYLSEKGRQVF